MDPNAIVGCVIVVLALGVLIYLVLWSRRRIDRIARNGFGTPRQIEKERRGEI